MKACLLIVLTFLPFPCFSTPIAIEAVYDEYRNKISLPTTPDQVIINYLEDLKVKNPSIYKKFMTTRSEQMANGPDGKEYPTYFAVTTNRAELLEYLLENKARLSNEFFKDPKTTLSPFFKYPTFAEKFIGLIYQVLQTRLSESKVNEFFSQLYRDSMPKHLADYREVITTLRSYEEKIKNQGKLLEDQDQELKKQGKQIQNNELALQEKDLALTKVGTSLREQADELAQVKNKLEVKLRKLQAKKQQLHNKDFELNDTKAILQMSDQTSSQLRAVLLDKDQKVEQLKAVLVDRDQKLQHHLDQLNSLRKNLRIYTMTLEVEGHFNMKQLQYLGNLRKAHAISGELNPKPDNKTREGGERPQIPLIYQQPAKEHRKTEYVAGVYIPQKQASMGGSQKQTYFGTPHQPRQYTQAIPEDKSKQRIFSRAVSQLIPASSLQGNGARPEASPTISGNSRGETAPTPPNQKVDPSPTNPMHQLKQLITEHKKQRKDYENKIEKLNQVNAELKKELEKVQQLNKTYQNEIHKLKQGAKSLSTS